jgi:hypothetical protein
MTQAEQVGTSEISIQRHGDTIFNEQKVSKRTGNTISRTVTVGPGSNGAGAGETSVRTTLITFSPDGKVIRRKHLSSTGRTWSEPSELSPEASAALKTAGRIAERVAAKQPKRPENSR